MALIQEQVLREIQLHRWYHAFEVLPGVVSPGSNFVDAADILDQRHRLPARLDGLKALDIGALDGPYTFELERRGAEVVALDIQHPDVTAFNVARRARRSQAHYVQGNVYHLGDIFGDHQFDVVLFFGVWNHLKHPLIALEQIHRVLHDDGLLCFEGECLLNHVPAPPDGAPCLSVEEARAIGRGAAPLSMFFAGAYKGDPWSWNIPNPACVRQWFESSAFEVLAEGCWDDPPHQRMHGNARKRAGQAIIEDNPIW